MWHEYPYQNNHELNLDWILAELNKFRTKFAEWEETINQLIEALKDIDDWENRIVALETITNQIPIIQKQLNDLSNLHDADIKYLKNLIDGLQQQINDMDVAALKAYVDSHDNMLQADFNNQIFENYRITYELFNGLKDRIIALAEAVAQIDTKAYNPWPRIIRKESLQTNLDYAYADLSDLVPDAASYSELNLSANDYNEYDLTARDYSLYGKLKLHMFYVFSPVYGFKQEISNVLTSIVNFVKGTLSADEFAALDITADDYTALDLTADDYYSYNNSLGYVGVGGAGLTANQYSELHVL